MSADVISLSARRDRRLTVAGYVGRYGPVAGGLTAVGRGEAAHGVTAETRWAGVALVATWCGLRGSPRPPAHDAPMCQRCHPGTRR